VTEIVYIMHDNPTGRQAPYYIAQVDLGYTELHDQVEQLWLNELGDDLFRVACIPFMAFGMAYLDIVTLDPGTGYVNSVHEKSGHRALRTLVEEDPEFEAQGRLESLARQMGVAYEVHRGRFLAFDIAPGTDPTPLTRELDTLEAAGRLEWEWSDVSPFQTSGRVAPPGSDKEKAPPGRPQGFGASR